MTTDLRRTIDDGSDVLARASTVGSPSPVDGAAALSACPDPQPPAGNVDVLAGWRPVFGPVERGRDRSPESLALLLVKAAERVRTDPGENFEDCAVRWSVDVLRSRLDERRPVLRGRSLDA